MKKWNNKCRFFDEKYACDTLTTENYKSCEECKFSVPYSKKILIIKLGAIGDVLRTTPILPAIKEKYGEDTLIYWMTAKNPNSVGLLKNNPMIDKVLEYNQENILRIQQENFDILFSLEIDTPATLLANLVRAPEKFGYYFDNGSASCFNPKAEEYLETAFLNHVKIKNRKTYQELIFNTCNLDYKKQKLFFHLNESHHKFSEEFKLKNNLLPKDKVIGINIGSASRWQSKFWDTDKIKKLIKELHREYKVLILAGPNEIDKQKDLIEKLSHENISYSFNNPNNTIDEFAAVVNLCDTVICGDSLALHLALALNKNTISLFFCTPPWEIEGYNSLNKIFSPLLEKHFFTNNYNKELADSISVEDVLRILEEQKQIKTTSPNNYHG